MRLVELKKVIKEANNLLTEYTASTYQDSYIITNVQPLKKALQLLIKSGILNSDSEEIQRVISSEGVNMLFDNNNVRNKVFNTIRDINRSVIYLNQWLDNIIPVEEEETEDTISICLPKMSDLVDLQKYVTSVQKGFTYITSTLEGGIIKFKTLDRGSDIITFAVGTPFIVTILVSFWKLGVRVIKDVYELKLLEQKLEQEKAKTEVINSAKEIYNNRVDKILNEGISEVLDSQNIKLKEKKEDLLRISNGIKELITLINDGAKIMPSLNASEEIAELFPGYVKLIDKQIRRLSDKSEE
jgi:hypothetical protein